MTILKLVIVFQSRSRQTLWFNGNMFDRCINVTMKTRSVSHVTCFHKGTNLSQFSLALP